MRLEHDEQGFLRGTKLALDEQVDQLALIRGELAEIKAAISGIPLPAVPASARDQVSAQRPAEAASVRAAPTATAVPAPAAVVQSNERLVEREMLRGLPAPALPTVPPAEAASVRAAPTATAVPAPAAVAPPARGADGRFLGRDAASDESNGHAVAGLQWRSSLKDMGERLAGAVTEIGMNEEADPTVKAFNEVAQPLSRGFAKVFSGNDDGGGTQGGQRWFRRIWRQLRDNRNAEKKEGRHNHELLEEIERQQGGESQRGGLATLALAPLLAALRGILAAVLPVGGLLKRALGLGGSPTGSRTTRSPAATGQAPSATGGGRGQRSRTRPASAGRTAGLAKGLGRKVPVLGALLSAGFAAKSIYDTERSSGSRIEKDRANGRALGGGAGALGGALAGGATGAALGSVVPVLGTAIGGVIGSVLGAWLGESAGSVIGETFGDWVNELRSADFTQQMATAWSEMTLFTGHLWGQVASASSAQWSAVTQATGALWQDVSRRAGEAWQASASAVTALWADAVGHIQGAFAAVTQKLAALWQGASEASAQLNDWVKQQTGVDVAASLSRAGGAISSAADSALNYVGEKASGALNYVGEKTSGALSYVGEKTGVSGAYRAVKKSAAYAQNRTALEQQMTRTGMTDPTERALFLAQMDHESGGLTQLEERFNYSSAENVMKVSATARGKGAAAVNAARAQGPEALAELMYGGRMGNTEAGDGYKFRGRGFTQLTGRDNYAAASRDLGVDLVNNPDLAASPEMAAKIATWYWQSKPGLAQAAKQGDVHKVSQKVNGGTNGMADRAAKSQHYLAQASASASTPQAMLTPPPVPASVEVASAPRATPLPAMPRALTQVASMPSLPPQPFGQNKAASSAVVTPEVAREVADRRIAHIVTGAYASV
ncbi:MAG: glycoside hydrolase family 19 protein [Aeromonas sp.]